MPKKNNVRNKKRKQIKRLISIVVAGIIIFLYNTNALWFFEYRLQDSLFQNPRLLHPDIFVIGIDQSTLDEFGSFLHWNREKMGLAIDILNTYADYGFAPAVIAVDILYTEASADYTVDQYLVNSVSRHDNVLMASNFYVGIPPGSFDLNPTIIGHARPFDSLHPYVSYGIVNSIMDRDGVVRNSTLWENFSGERYYSFAFMAALMYSDYWGLPLESREAYTYIRFAGMPGDFFELSFSEIFEPDFDPSWFAGSIVLIGPYATGMMDHFNVPIYHGEHMFGVEIHANTIQAILDNLFVTRVSSITSLLIIVILVIFSVIFSEIFDIRIVVLTFLTIGIAYYFVSLYMFENGYIIPVLFVFFAISIIFIYQLIYGYILDTIEKNHMRSVFKKYVDPKLVDVLIKTKEADSDEIGTKKDIAVLFVDIRGFTPMTEVLRDKPEIIVEILNEYLNLTSSAIFENGGSVDKFIGDATMALFNGFVPLEDYVYKAVKTAYEMLQGATEVNARLKEKFGVDVGFGIGVHCGDAIVGNLGPNFRKDYTAIGDTVNTTARLESNAKRSQVLLSQDVVNILKDRISVTSIGEISLKGKEIPMEIFSLESLN